MLCGKCKKEIAEEDLYVFEGKNMCEGCAINEGLYPLEHTGSRRDMISERGRHLTIPKNDKNQ